MFKKLIFLALCVSLSLSPLAQAAQTQNQNDTLKQSAQSHDLKTLTEAATNVVNNLSDEEKITLVKHVLEKSNAHLTPSVIVLIAVGGVVTILAPYLILDCCKKYLKDKDV